MIDEIKARFKGDQYMPTYLEMTRMVTFLLEEVDRLQAENEKLKSESVCHGDECRIRELSALQQQNEELTWKLTVQTETALQEQAKREQAECQILNMRSCANCLHGDFDGYEYDCQSTEECLNWSRWEWEMPMGTNVNSIFKSIEKNHEETLHKANREIIKQTCRAEQAEAQAAVTRTALEKILAKHNQPNRKEHDSYGPTTGICLDALNCTAGAELLAELTALRRENAELRRGEGKAE